MFAFLFLGISALIISFVFLPQIRQLKTDLVKERFERIAFELYVMTLRFEQERGIWPKTVRDLLMAMEYRDSPCRINPDLWLVVINPDETGSGWRIDVRSSDGKFCRTFGAM